MIQVPDYVKWVMTRLEENGFRAYLVGGGVRDILIGRDPKDYDISTEATPRQIKALFEKSVPISEGGPADVTLIMEVPVEVNTLRSNGILYTNDLDEDLSKRDFTVNAMAMDLSGRLYDNFGGLEDVRGRVIKTVGLPGERFVEDPLRMLRAVRFAVLFDFCIDPETEKGIYRCAGLIIKVDQGRVREEICKIVLSEYPSYGVEVMDSTGLLGNILPELTASRGNGGGFEKMLGRLNDSPKKIEERLATLMGAVEGGVMFRMFYSGRPAVVKKALKRLKFDRKTIETVLDLL